MTTRPYLCHYILGGLFWNLPHSTHRLASCSLFWIYSIPLELFAIPGKVVSCAPVVPLGPIVLLFIMWRLKTISPMTFLETCLALERSMINTNIESQLISTIPAPTFDNGLLIFPLPGKLRFLDSGRVSHLFRTILLVLEDQFLFSFISACFRILLDAPCIVCFCGKDGLVSGSSWQAMHEWWRWHSAVAGTGAFFR